MGLENIEDIEIALRNLDYIDPALNDSLQKRKQEILEKMQR